MKPILEIQHISKRFRIQHEQQAYLSLRDSLASLLKKSGSSTEEFYALNDVSFNVYPGESIGIIGKNGAGKSTLLKILSKITPPSSGKIISRGRIASLLEVGTGFHAELSGRENVFLNGSILGMKRAEIMKNFDAIVDFAGVEKFLDTPLKHYSSGMQLRLAFAVAAFLENEILIIDEVLAVGDAEFQKKCMGKMEDVSKSGRTLLFVSHQLGLISSLCKTGLVLNKGAVHAHGPISDAVASYLKLGKSDQNKFTRDEKTIAGKEYVIREVSTMDQHSEPAEEFFFDQSVFLKINISVNEFIPNTHIGVALLDKMENRVFTVVKEIQKSDVHSGMIRLRLKLQAGIIAPNSYSFVVAAFVPNLKVVDVIENICRISVIDSGTALSKFEGIDYGSVIVDAQWES